MAIYINGIEATNIKYDGVTVSEVYLNGTKVFPVVPYHTWEKWDVYVPVSPSYRRYTSDTVLIGARTLVLHSAPSIVKVNGVYRFNFSDSVSENYQVSNVRSGMYCGSNSDSVQTDTNSDNLNRYPAYYTLCTGQSSSWIQATISGDIYQITEGTHTKGSTLIETVTGNTGDYPVDGEQNGYWYVQVS